MLERSTWRIVYSWRTPSGERPVSGVLLQGRDQMEMLRDFVRMCRNMTDVEIVSVEEASEGLRVPEFRREGI